MALEASGKALPSLSPEAGHSQTICAACTTSVQVTFPSLISPPGSPNWQPTCLPTHPQWFSLLAYFPISVICHRFFPGSRCVGMLFMHICATCVGYTSLYLCHGRGEDREEGTQVDVASTMGLPLGLFEMRLGVLRPKNRVSPRVGEGAGTGSSRSPEVGQRLPGGHQTLRKDVNGWRQQEGSSPILPSWSQGAGQALPQQATFLGQDGACPAAARRNSRCSSTHITWTPAPSRSPASSTPSLQVTHSLGDVQEDVRAAVRRGDEAVALGPAEAFANSFVDWALGSPHRPGPREGRGWGGPASPPRSPPVLTGAHLPLPSLIPQAVP